MLQGLVEFFPLDALLDCHLEADVVRMVVEELAWNSRDPGDHGFGHGDLSSVERGRRVRVLGARHRLLSEPVKQRTVGARAPVSKAVPAMRPIKRVKELLIMGERQLDHPVRIESRKDDAGDAGP